MVSTAVEMPEADLLIIGIGPAGGALAAFAAQYDLKIIAIAKAPGTADTTRAHLVNPFGIECLRELGLEDDAIRHTTIGDSFKEFRLSNNITSEDYGKVLCWGAAPSNIGESIAASPCTYIDLPQTLLEPLLVRKATEGGRVSAHFNTTFVSYTRDLDTKTIISTVKDNLTGHEYQIRSRFLHGADGGRSQVAKEMQVEFVAEPMAQQAVNILIEADCNHLMAGREAQLHWCVGAPSQTRLRVISCMRMVKPWTSWLLIMVESPGGSSKSYKNLSKDDPELLQLIRELIGDESVPFKILRIDPWLLRESVAKNSTKSMMSLSLETPHTDTRRLLGSNTSMQDAYNLAWKLAYVAKGLASPELLHSFSPERVPVGTKLVKASTKGFMTSHIGVWKALGAFAPTYEVGKLEREELSHTNKGGEIRRAILHSALEGMRVEAESLGTQMNQQYVSNAVFLDDEKPRPEFKGDPVVNGDVTTYPGSRLPHAWLSGKTSSQKISTIDLSGFGAFSLFTGHGGQAWKDAAASVSKLLGDPINAYGIGWRLDYHDKYRFWIERREVGEDGCLLVGPDKFVAWRSMKMIDGCEGKLLHVMKTVLSRKD